MVLSVPELGFTPFKPAGVVAVQVKLKPAVGDVRFTAALEVCVQIVCETMLKFV
jgi:hypothetical protein